jgi:hypothetical protein
MNKIKHTSLIFGERVPIDLMRYAVQAAKFLRISKPNSINVDFTINDLPNQAWGLCWGDLDPIVIIIATKSGQDSLNEQQILRTLSHELVHASQYLSGRLVVPEHPDQPDIWEGEPVHYLAEEEIYCPWEIEAERIGDRIYDLFGTDIIINY